MKFAIRWYQFSLRNLALVIALMSVYLGSYRAFLRPKIVPTEGNLGWTYGYRQPEFRFGGVASQFVFAPLVWVDRRIRPDYWNEYRATWEDFQKENKGEIHYGPEKYGSDQ